MRKAICYVRYEIGTMLLDHPVIVAGEEMKDIKAMARAETLNAVPGARLTGSFQFFWQGTRAGDRMLRDVS